MLANSISVGVSPEELREINRLRGHKTIAEHIRDNAMAYGPEEVSVTDTEDRKQSVKTSLFPIEEYILRKRLQDSGIDFGKATKATNWHNFLRCVALMPPKNYNRQDYETHKNWQEAINEGKLTMEDVAKIVEALQ